MEMRRNNCYYKNIIILIRWKNKYHTLSIKVVITLNKITYQFKITYQKI